MTFLSDPEETAGARRMYDADLADDGFVMNLTRLWAHAPEADTAFRDLTALASAGQSMRERGVLVTATAAALGDSYCALAWGGRLADEAGADVAAATLSGEDDAVLDARDRALASWARAVVRDPSGTTSADLEPLRAAGYDDAAIFSLTLYVGLRLAFSSVNGALGAAPDHEVADAAPPAVRAAVTWGRAPA
ncbi:hypothetical protein GCM10023340_07660 [Nocardioides marinquilinus]|uniref:Carboxymuconolactone decarboxylase family protein n=1 Tax=Nocardioides marinquilinus TaxID=1210400 RepID=A0ABP9PCZ7_9ACTN